MALSQINLNRRTFLTAVAGGVATAALAATGGRKTAEGAIESQQSSHLAWVWAFDEDGRPEAIRNTLAENGLGVILKTHDGTSWMGKWDKTSTAINGASDIRRYADFFEQANVPFHAWCVTKGQDPYREAEMAAEVLASGARSVTFDLEPREGAQYWLGDPSDARILGEQLRRTHPDAWLSVAPDPRPWKVKDTPMAEFAGFCDEIAPQTYWRTFDSSANYRLLREYGFEVPNGVTPELLLDVTQKTLERYGRPIRPIGQGDAGGDDWRRFVGHSYSLGWDAVALWRYGVTWAEVWPTLGELKPRQAEPAPIEVTEPEDAKSSDEDKVPAAKRGYIDKRKRVTPTKDRTESEANVSRNPFSLGNSGETSRNIFSATKSAR